MGTEESVIPGTAGTCRTLVDGSLRLSVDFEPRYRAKAMELFGEPGSAMALARLTQESEAERLQEESIDNSGQAVKPQQNMQAEVEQDLATPGGMPKKAKDGRPKHSAAVIAAFQLPKEEKFQEFLRTCRGSLFVTNEAHAVGYLKKYCDVAHRCEIDFDKEAAKWFAQLRGEYGVWLREQRRGEG